MRSSLAIYDALTSVSVPRSKAYRVAQALETDMTQFREGLATKDDIRRLEAATKADIRRLEAAMKTDVERLETATKADISGLEITMKADIDRLEAATRADIKRLETATKADISGLEVNMARLETRVLRTIILATSGLAALITVLHFIA